MKIGIGIVALSVVLSGCLATNYSVPEDELERLVELPAEERGASVRVVQRLMWDDEPPETPDRSRLCDDHTHFSYVHIHGYHHHGHHHGHGGSVGVSGGGGGGGGGGTSVGGSKEMAALVVMTAAAFTVGMVATEGMRYDGWLNVDNDQPVHLLMANGESNTVPLSALSREDLKNSTDAVIATDGGWNVKLDERAPLSREGLTWKFELGTMELAPPVAVQPSTFAALTEIGYFPEQTFGVLAFLSLGIGDHEGNDALAVRYGVEAQWLPIQFSRLHLGGYAAFGMSYDALEGPTIPLSETSGQIFSVGGLAELDLTTRLALSLRAGLTQHVSDSRVPSTFMATAGFAVY